MRLSVRRRVEMSRSFLLLAMIVGLSSPWGARAQQALTTRSLAALVETVDAKYQRAPSVLDDRDITIEFPLITGSIFGAPSTGAVLIERARLGQTVKLDLERLRENAARFASPLNPQMAAAGMVVEPHNARFARVGTFVSVSQTDRSMASGVFVQPETRIALALVYFDEPCRISGLLRLGFVEANHDIVIASRGLHWIRINEPTNNRYDLQNAEAFERVILGIQPNRKASAGKSV